jgi:predicted glycogen debranching enzyme
LVTERFEEARRIFRAFAAHNSQGMIPNRFPDAGETPDYNTVDATLWFFVALYKYLNYTDDYAFVRNEMWATLKDIVEWHGRGTRYHIHVDGDRLLHAGEQGVQLTWMDAKVGDWVVTPRQGKAVEINALWYNALKIAAHLATRFDDPQAAQNYSAQAATVATRFAEVFWNSATGCLFDVVNNGQGDGAIRPNQIFALSLPFPLLSEPQALQVFDVIDRHLFTPRGLRSLSPKDPAYRPVFTSAALGTRRCLPPGHGLGLAYGPVHHCVSKTPRPSGPSARRHHYRGYRTTFERGRLGHRFGNLRRRTALHAAWLYCPGVERGRVIAGLLRGCVRGLRIEVVCGIGFGLFDKKT